jgi:ferredoxin
MRVVVDLERCEGHGLCVATAPELFEFDPEGLSRVLHPFPGSNQDSQARAAARACPLQAILVIEDEISSD